MNNQQRWEKTVQTVLGDKSPCIECLVQVSCTKSFSHGSACDKLREALRIALENIHNED